MGESRCRSRVVEPRSPPGQAGADVQGLLEELARIYRFNPDPKRLFDARHGKSRPWIDMAQRTNNPAMKSENVLYHDGWLYVTSSDGYSYQKDAASTVYRVKVED